MSDAERSKKLIAEKAYNQCSITIRVEGEEIEIPIDFGHTADEIRQIYPFILPLVNKKIKNPAIEFNEKARAGAFDGLTDDEYNQVVLNMKEQSRYWYDKQEASVLELAMRFALDIELRKFDELVYIFTPIERLDAIKSSTLTEEETSKVVREMKLEPDADLERDAGEHNVTPNASGELSFNIYGSDVTDEPYSDTLDEMEKQVVSEDVFKAILDKDSKEINTERYKSTYKSGPYEESLVKDGRVDIYNEDEEKEVPSLDAVDDDALADEIDASDEISEDFVDDDIDTEDSEFSDDMLDEAEDEFEEIDEEGIDDDINSFLDDEEDEFEEFDEEDDRKDDEE